MPDDIVLYVNADWTSPYAFSTFVALSEKRIPFRTEAVNLEKGEHQRHITEQPKHKNTSENYGTTCLIQ